MKLTGIYKIQSLSKPERIYIGSAINFENRKYEHLKKLRRNTHHSKYLQNHFNKYGESDLIFTFILGCEKESLLIHEQYFLDALNPCFNVCKKAGNTLGIKGVWSEETRHRFSEYRKANSKGEKNGFFHKKHTDEAKRKMSLKRKGKKLNYITGGKGKFGEKNPNSKLSNKQIQEILMLCEHGSFGQNTIAKVYKVSKDTIYRLNAFYNKGIAYKGEKRSIEVIQ